MPPDLRVSNLAIEHAASLLQTELEAKREAISRELGTIPPPVPACDVNFNRLLEERAGLIDELQRLRRLLAAGGEADAVLVFCRESAGVSEATKAQVERMLDRSTH
jgi:hypothetical protein